jgi:anti-anti-sigma factor
MPETNLTATVRPASPGASIVDLQGTIDAQSEDVLTGLLHPAHAAGAGCILLNFSAVGHINSAGLGRLVMLQASARLQGRRLLAYALSALHHQVFRLSRLDEAIEVRGSEAEAVAAASAPAPRLPLAGAPPDGAAPLNGWAAPVSRLTVTGIPAGVANLNVHGRALAGPVQGFGPLWKKAYEVRLAGATVTPLEAIQAWKANFGSFWPKGNRFYGRPSGLEPGDVAVLHLAGPGGLNPPGGLPLIATGLMVVYVDDLSFCFMASAGHTIAGMITFSAHEDALGTLVRIEPIFRPNDPFFELMFRLGLGNFMEDTFWRQILRNLASHFGSQTEPRLTAICVDPNLQWREAGNLWQNAAIHTTFYILGAPLRRVAGLFRKKQAALPGGE